MQLTAKCRPPAQTLRIMRLTTFLMLVFCLHLSAKTRSQEITLSAKNASLKELFGVIKKQTGYFVFYKTDLLNDRRPVSITATHLPLTEFLDLILKDQALGYRLSDKTIMLFEKAAGPAASPEGPAAASPADQAPVTVQGHVTSQGKPVVGASVLLSPAHRGTTTDQDGHFEFQHVYPGKYSVETSSIGYKSITSHIVVTSDPILLTLTMEQALNTVEEVVVTNGYSSKRAGELTGSVQKISGDDLRMGITTSDPVSLLKGRATGLYISEQNAGDPTSSGGQIFVRGQSSIAGVGVDQINQFIMPTLNYGPLLVLDGVIMPNQNMKEIVTPQEIEDVTILKDAAATAIYGSRAAAGVIVINTKRGHEGKPRITAEVKYGLNEPNRGSVHFDTGPELYALQKEYYTDDYQVNGASLGAQYPSLQDYLNYRLPTADALAHSFDWQKYAFLSSNDKEVNVGASGGNDRTRYYMGATYYNEQSTGVKNGLIRKSFRMNLESKLTDRLTATVAINGILNDGIREMFNTGATLYQFVPWANPYDAKGNLNNELDYKLAGFQQSQANPIYDNQWNFDKPTSQLLFGSARLTYKITDWLTFSSINSGNLNYTKDVQYIDVRSFVGGSPVTGTAPQGYLGTTTNNLISYLTSNQLSFHKTAGDHSFSALAAMEYGKTSNDATTIYVNHVQAGYPQISLANQIGYAYDYSAYGIPSTKAGNIEGGETDQAVYSLFGEAEYTFRKRYSISGSVRRDASSAFGADRRYGTFGSGGAAWIVSNENFMKNLKAISNLKLRANYGTSGSQLGDNFLTQTLLKPGYTYGGQNGVSIANLANPDLRWEVTKTFSGGIDLGLFGRINATIDAYDRRSENLLQQVTLPSIIGFANQWQNVGIVRNRGLEILINADIVKQKDFSWTASFNISFNKNSIVHVANDSLPQGLNYYLYKGDDINALKAVKYAGVDPQTGKPQFEKLLFDGNGHRSGVQLVNTLSEVGQNIDYRQMQTVGSFQPKYYGGLTNTFTYKHFSLNVLITYTMKFVMLDLLAQQMQAGTFFSSFNQVSFLKNQHLWTHPGQTNATEPWLYYQVNTNYNGSDKYMHDGSNARLRSVRLSYSLPDTWMKRAKLSNCTFYISGDNLYTLYSKKIVTSDPEGPSVGTSQTYGQSIGSGIGIPRRFVFGAQITL
jgi:TonB-linked SusC/RagA family outer membrane protein